MLPSTPLRQRGFVFVMVVRFAAFDSTQAARFRLYVGGSVATFDSAQTASVRLCVGASVAVYAETKFCRNNEISLTERSRRQPNRYQSIRPRARTSLPCKLVTLSPKSNRILSAFVCKAVTNFGCTKARF